MGPHFTVLDQPQLRRRQELCANALTLHQGNSYSWLLLPRNLDEVCSCLIDLTYPSARIDIYWVSNSIIITIATRDYYLHRGRWASGNKQNFRVLDEFYMLMKSWNTESITLVECLQHRKVIAVVQLTKTILLGLCHDEVHDITILF